MRSKICENLSKFMYDCGKVPFALLFMGALIKKPIIWKDVSVGYYFTLLFVIAGIIIDMIGVHKENG